MTTLAHRQMKGGPSGAVVTIVLLGWLALVALITPAAAERLVTSLSNHRVEVSSNFTGDVLVARLAHRPLVDRAVDRNVRPEDLLWHRRRVRPVACAATNPRPRFRPAR